MRNFINATEYNDRIHGTNYSVIQQHIDDDYYVVDLTPADFVLSGNAVTPSTAATIIGLSTANQLTPVVLFRNGFTDEAKFSFRSRLYWEKGNFELTLYFTGSTSNTNNIQWSWRGFTHALSEDITASAIISPDDTVAGPATALTMKKYTFTTYLPFSREKEFIHGRLFRTSTSGSDTYTGDVYLIMARIRFIPALIQTGTTG